MYSKLAYSTLRRLSLAVALLALQLMIVNAKPPPPPPPLRCGRERKQGGSGSQPLTTRIPDCHLLGVGESFSQCEVVLVLVPYGWRHRSQELLYPGAGSLACCRRDFPAAAFFHLLYTRPPHSMQASSSHVSCHDHNLCELEDTVVTRELEDRIRILEDNVGSPH